MFEFNKDLSTSALKTKAQEIKAVLETKHNVELTPHMVRILNAFEKGETPDGLVLPGSELAAEPAAEPLVQVLVDEAVGADLEPGSVAAVVPAAVEAVGADLEPGTPGNRKLADKLLARRRLRCA